MLVLTRTVDQPTHPSSTTKFVTALACNAINRPSLEIPFPGKAIDVLKRFHMKFS